MWPKVGSAAAVLILPHLAPAHQPCPDWADMRILTEGTHQKDRSARLHKQKSGPGISADERPARLQAKPRKHPKHPTRLPCRNRAHATSAQRQLAGDKVAALASSDESTQKCGLGIKTELGYSIRLMSWGATGAQQTKYQFSDF